MPRSKASNEAQYRYNAKHLKRVPLDLQLSDYEELKQAADAAGLSVNGFIKAAIKAAISVGVDPVQPLPVGESGGTAVGEVTESNSRE